MVTDIGTYKNGEKPVPITVTFVDSSGAAVNITGYTVKWVFKQRGEASETNSAALTNTGSDGKGTYIWQADDFTTPGFYEGEMWAGNGTNRYASETFVWEVAQCVADTPPSI